MGVRLAVTPLFERRMTLQAYDQDVMMLPELFVREFSIHAEQLVRPLLDTVWQAARVPRCFDYTEDGEWKLQT